MENIIREGESFIQNDQGMGGQGNSDQAMVNQQGGNNQGMRNDQQSQGQTKSSGGGFMAGAEQMAGDAYVNQGINSFLTKEGVPVAMDGAIDGVADQEVNRIEKDF